MMTHLLRCAWLALLGLALTLPAHAETSRHKVTLLLICDIYEMAANKAGRGGLARIATALKQERARNPHTIVAHAGDAISPSLMSSLDQGRHMIDLLGDLKLDVFVPGNHEFDFGPDVFKARMAEAGFPVLAGNVRNGDGSAIPGIAPTRMIEAQGLTIGVAGFTAEDSVSRSSPGNLQFTATMDSTLSVTSQLRKAGADLVVHVVHAPRPVDVQLMQEGAADIILSGDDHDLMMQFNGKTAFVEAMQDGWYVAAVDVDVEIEVRDGKRKVSWWPNFRFIDTAAVEPDPDMLARIAVYEKQLSDALDKPVAELTSPLNSSNAEVRGGEAAIGNLYADALRAATAADAALLNGGGFRGNRQYDAGDTLTRRDVLKELPFSNKVFVLQVTGKQLRAALEQGFAKADNLTGAFPQVSGLKIRADLAQPAGARVLSVEVAGKPLDDAASYTLATSDFLAGGGDGYTALQGADVLVGDTDARLLTDVVIAHLADQQKVGAAIEGRIVVGRQAQPQ
jgi:5'-nucleotidase/UDP-sugar diphosphatase